MSVLSMQTPVMGVANRKGGPGKTTIAVNVSAAVAALGKRVLLVDADSQGQDAVLLNQPEENGLFRLVVKQESAGQILRKIPPEMYQINDTPGDFYLLPGSALTYSITDYEIGRSDPMVIADHLSMIAGLWGFDVVIVDTQPSITLFDAALWMSFSHFLYVTTLDRLSVAGLQSGIEQLISFNTTRHSQGLPAVQVAGIIPNRVKGDTLVHQTVGNELAEKYQRLMWSPVLERQTWQRAAQIQKIVYKYSPGGQAAKDCWEMARRVLEVLDAR